jgi:hypothetical protein
LITFRYFIYEINKTKWATILATTVTEQYKYRTVTTENSVKKGSNMELCDEKSDDLGDVL